MKVNLQIENKAYLNGTSRRIPAIVGRIFRIGSWEFVWWGFSQLDKWRWHGDHIDLGALSVYGFRSNHWFWRIVASFPIFRLLRWNYHRRFKGNWLERYKEQLQGLG